MKSLFVHGYGLSLKVKNTRLVFSQGIESEGQSADIGSFFGFLAL